MTEFYREKNNLSKAYASNIEEAIPLSRVYDHTKNRNIGALTAFRGEYSLQENRKRNEELKKHIRDAGFGFVKVKGRYIENQGTDSETPVDEESFLVIGGDDSKSTDRLKSFLKKAGEKYDQDSILFKGVDDDSAQLHFTAGEDKGDVINVGRWSPQLLSEFQSVIHESKKADKNVKRGFEFTERKQKENPKKGFKQLHKDWWDDLSKEEKKSYIKKHPNTKHKLD